MKLPNILTFAVLVALTACARTPEPLPPPAVKPRPTATAPSASTIDPSLAALDAYLITTAADRFSGAVIVARGDTVLLRKGYGLANRSWDAPFAPDTKVQIASLTKQFTGAAILKLQDEGKLTARDPVCRWIRECPPAWSTMTLHHLLTHTAGVPEILNRRDYAEVARRKSTPREQTAASTALPLDFEPGAGFRYSNGGYQILGDIIERASGQTYAAYLQQTFFTPLGMTDTGYEDGRTDIPRLAQGYDREGGQPVRPYWRDPSVIFSAGGLYSTADDLLRWTRALHAGRVVSPTALAQMTGRVGPDYPLRERERYDLIYAYGLMRAPAGLMVEPGFADEQVFHTGSWHGFRNYVTHVPSAGVTVVVVSNRIDQSSTVLLTAQKGVAAALTRPEPTGFPPPA